MQNPTEVWNNMSAENTQVLICDLQQQIVARSKTTPPDSLSQSAEVLCKIAELFNLPLTLSVVPENNQKPKLIPQLDAFANDSNEFLRATASPFVEPNTKKHLASFKRPNLIIAGFATEVVVLHAALHARREGYGVLIAADACGGQSERTQFAAMQQIRDSGCIVSSVVSIATALAMDFTTPQGQQMFQIVQTLRLA